MAIIPNIIPPNAIAFVNMNDTLESEFNKVKPNPENKYTAALPYLARKNGKNSNTRTEWTDLQETSVEIIMKERSLK